MFDSLRIKMKFSRRVREAAKQMYAHVQLGKTFEVPNGQGTDDLTTRAVLCLRQLHPNDVKVMYQARGVLIGPLHKTAKIADGTMQVLEKGRYLPEAQLAHHPEAFMADQNAWLVNQGLVREDEVKEGQRRQAERDRIVLSGVGKITDAEKPVDAEKLIAEMLKPVDKAEPKATAAEQNEPTP